MTCCSVNPLRPLAVAAPSWQCQRPRSPLWLRQCRPITGGSMPWQLLPAGARVAESPWDGAPHQVETRAGLDPPWTCTLVLHRTVEPR